MNPDAKARRNAAETERVMHRLGFGKDECSTNVAALRARLLEIAAKGTLRAVNFGNISETLSNEVYAGRILAALGPA